MIDIWVGFFLQMRANLVRRNRRWNLGVKTFSGQGGVFFSYFSFAGIQQWADRRIEAIARIENPTRR
jgi:hypothetical protein